MTRHFTAREFNQDIAGAKRAAREGPVIITDRGQPAHVLLSYDEYRRLGGEARGLVDLLAWPGTEDIALTLAPRAMATPFAFDTEE
ncbi:type II toxin-antitoxin system Phd/YefM family antitoxin [Sphingomonas sp. KR1UV-12]|uniref:Antitoxin n=1 Tax=Sphingomonas aurea TaxID=3063994 RepID=A0ABT9EMB1_9SPHN|nr:type II toxin-antitoxin system Phd/YefM family antitoxin [Sphingomonas sp. KR1UV-12]MDP1027995.1 type II toxin-antitoxin system Phd/YefM family antitoxin [Sphingomonas sp. KR1UV-12]